jgi:hypothetical protein
MYLDAQQLDMLPKHYKALEKGKTITLPFKSLGVGRDVMLSKEQSKKIAKAITKGSGVRLSMTPDQVELHRGAGLWEEMKELIKENKKFIIEKGVPAFTAAVAVATAANPVVSTAFLAMTPGMQMAVEDIINQYIEDKDPSTLKQRLQILKKYLTAKQIKELATMIMGVGSVAGAGTKIGDQKFSINEVIKTLGGKKVKAGVADDKFSINEAKKAVKGMFGKGVKVADQKFSVNDVVKTFGGKKVKAKVADDKFSINEAIKEGKKIIGKGVRGRPRTRGMPLVGQTSDMVLTQKGEIDPTISSRDSAIEYEGGDILKDIDKAFKKVGKTINKKVIKPAGKYITAKKGGLASDLIDYGIPAATGAIVGGITGLATGGVGGVIGSAAGSKLGKEVIAPEIRKLTGAGHCGMPADMCGCGVGGALMPAGYDGKGLMPAGMGLMPAGMGLKPAGSGVYMPAGRTIVRHGKGVRARVMVPKKVTVEGGAMMPQTSSAGTGDFVPIMIDTPAFYTPLM